MRYGSVVPARFLARPNRFIALVDLDGRQEAVHVKNTGRCRELLVPGAPVYLEKGTNPGRKTAYDLIAVQKGQRLINMDAQAPNKVYGSSRLDFCLETPRGPHLVEVKGVTLEEGGAARFPDAPTERGVKHIRELCGAAEAGLDATLFFVVQMEGICSVAPNDVTHPAFGAALREAACRGVNVCARGCLVTPDSIVMGGPIPVLL